MSVGGWPASVELQQLVVGQLHFAASLLQQRCTIRPDAGVV